MKTYKGTVTISRVSSSHSGDFIEIRLRDESSRVVFVEAEIDLQSFAKAITGQGEVSANMEYRGLELVGTKAEHKEELVPCDPFNSVQRNKALKAFEVDGWHARHGDIENHHRFVSGKGVNVVFFRNVGKPIWEQEKS